MRQFILLVSAVTWPQYCVLSSSVLAESLGLSVHDKCAPALSFCCSACGSEASKGLCVAVAAPDFARALAWSTRSFTCRDKTYTLTIVYCQLQHFSWTSNLHLVDSLETSSNS